MQYLLTEEEYKNGSVERCAELEETCIKLTKDIEDYQKIFNYISNVSLKGCDNVCRVSCPYSTESLIKLGVSLHLAKHLCNRQHKVSKIAI